MMELVDSQSSTKDAFSYSGNNDVTNMMQLWQYALANKTQQGGNTGKAAQAMSGQKNSSSPQQEPYAKRKEKSDAGFDKKTEAFINGYDKALKEKDPNVKESNFITPRTEGANKVITQQQKEGIDAITKGQGEGQGIYNPDGSKKDLSSQYWRPEGNEKIDLPKTKAENYPKESLNDPKHKADIEASEKQSKGMQHETMKGRKDEIPVHQTVNYKDRESTPININRLNDSFQEYIGTNGPSGQELPIQEKVKKDLESMGIPYKQDENGNIIANIPATKGKDNIAYDGANYFSKDGEKILGADDRAGTAQIIEATKTILEKNAPHPAITIVLSNEEEKGKFTVKPEDLPQGQTLGYMVDGKNLDNVFLKSEDKTDPNKRPNYTSFNHSPDSPISQLYARSLADAGVQPRFFQENIADSMRGTANRTPLNNNNIHSMTVGTGAKGIHTPLERISSEDLAKGSQTLVELVQNACDYTVVNNQIVPRDPVK